MYAQLAGITLQYFTNPTTATARDPHIRLGILLRRPHDQVSAK